MKAHDPERLSAYYDGALTLAERAAVDAHLRSCDACADYLADLAALDEGARGLPAEAPAGYFEQFPSRVRARMKAGGRRRWTPVWVGAAAAAVLLAVLTPHMMGEKSAAPPSAARSSDELPRAGAPAAAPPVVAPAMTLPTQAQPAPAPERLREAAPVPRAQEGGPVQKKLETRQAPAEAKDDGAAFAPPPAAPPPATASGELAGGAVGGAPGAAPEPQAMTEKTKRQNAAEEADRRDADSARDEEQAARAAQKLADKPAANEAPATAGRAAPSAALAKAAGAGTAEEARAARERWRATAERDPRHGDEARYRIVEEGARAFQLSADPRDRTIAAADARAYLARPGAFATRVREILKDLER